MTDGGSPCVVSVNVGRPRESPWQGKVVRSGILKDAVHGPVMARAMNLDGDGQADLAVHGGLEKAVYAYPAEHYPFWGERLAIPLPWGAFGENLTITGLLETDVHIGDRLRIGGAEFLVTQPRFPCSKLGMRLGRVEMVGWFLASGRTGFYLSVAREGPVRANDALAVIERDPRRVSVAAFVDVRASAAPAPDVLRRLLEVPALPQRWRERFAALIQDRLVSGRAGDA